MTTIEKIDDDFITQKYNGKYFKISSSILLMIQISIISNGLGNLAAVYLFYSFNNIVFSFIIK